MGLAKKDGEYLIYSKEVLYVPSIVRLEDVTAKGKDMLGMLWPSWQGLKWWEMVARLYEYTVSVTPVAEVGRHLMQEVDAKERRVLLISILLLFGKLKSNPKFSEWFWMHHLMPHFLMLDRSSSSSWLVRAVPSSPACEPCPELVLQTHCSWFACVREICCFLPNWWTNSQFNMWARISRLENGDDNRRKRTEIH